ncbi:MAG: uncultured phage MedDCM-OCT-S30-C28 [Bacteroidota bacterium]|jgi:hypothetical protein
MKYSNSFTHDLKFGEEAEDWVKKLLSNGFKVEVKNDRLIHKTGNIFIEYESRGKPSGLSTTTANYWIYRMNELDIAFIIPTDKLKKICREYLKENKYIRNGGDNNTSLGLLIPFTTLLNDIAAYERTRERSTSENDIPRH